MARTVPGFADFPLRPHPASETRTALEAYLAKTGAAFPKILVEIVESGKLHPLHEAGLRAGASAPPPSEDPILQRLGADEPRMREAYIGAMKKGKLDAFVLPVAS